MVNRWVTAMIGLVVLVGTAGCAPSGQVPPKSRLSGG
jgi:hypothetical protein